MRKHRGSQGLVSNYEKSMAWCPSVPDVWLHVNMSLCVAREMTKSKYSTGPQVLLVRPVTT